MFAPALNAISAPWPEGKYFIMACLQNLHPGQSAIFACWPDCKIRLLASRQFSHSGRLRAVFASQENANFARLLHAEFARDSYDYLRVFF